MSAGRAPQLAGPGAELPAAALRQDVFPSLQEVSRDEASLFLGPGSELPLSVGRGTRGRVSSQARPQLRRRLSSFRMNKRAQSRLTCPVGMRGAAQGAAQALEAHSDPQQFFPSVQNVFCEFCEMPARYYLHLQTFFFSALLDFSLSFLTEI